MTRRLRVPHAAPMRARSGRAVARAAGHLLPLSEWLTLRLAATTGPPEAGSERALMVPGTPERRPHARAATVDPSRTRGRVVATLLFCDIVGSTRQVASLGDARWGRTLEAYALRVREQARCFEGRVIKFIGDGALVAFDRPSHGVACADAIRREVAPLGIQVRSGLHSGEVDVTDEEDVAGLSVHIAARIAESAQPGEIVVSHTVADLMAGSDLVFLECEQRQLVDVPGLWRLLTVEGAAADG